MRIVLVGYGKMGKTIEHLAMRKGHEIVRVIDQDNIQDLRGLNQWSPDVAIEFTNPDSAHQNIITILGQNIPVVSGTTGWLDKWTDIEKAINNAETAFFYASNYSIGVNILFYINEQLAKLMDKKQQYKASITETHHVHKVDSPSGTAISLAEGIIRNHSSYEQWAEATVDTPVLSIESIRASGVFGIHEIKYTSDEDTLQIYHEAHSRDGFASGAILAAEWILGRKGIFGMKDLLAL